MSVKRSHYDVVAIGGGLIGSAVAFGLARAGIKTMLLDEGDRAFRAARGNFGLVWVQSKGSAFRPYAALSRDASTAWPELARTLAETTGIDVGLNRAGGLTFCFSEAEFEQRRAFMMKQFDADLLHPGAYEMLDRSALQRLVGELGSAVVGASYCRLDGDVNPLRLLRALQAAFQKHGGTYRSNAGVRTIKPSREGFSIVTAVPGEKMVTADRVVLAAGLANATLAPHVDLVTPVKPLRGQILVTEKMARFLPLPTHVIRQTDEGGMLIGDSKEDVGFDDDTELGVMGEIAQRALAVFPRLAAAKVIRAWGGLRVMTPDGAPLYQQSANWPGAFAFSVHSGVTLAPLHATLLAAAVADGRLSERLQQFSERGRAL